VINNAGMNVVGEVEFTTVELFERGFDVNLYGPIRIIKAFLPLIRNATGNYTNGYLMVSLVLSHTNNTLTCSMWSLQFKTVNSFLSDPGI